MSRRKIRSSETASTSGLLPKQNYSRIKTFKKHVKRNSIYLYMVSKNRVHLFLSILGLKRFWQGKKNSVHFYFFKVLTIYLE